MISPHKILSKPFFRKIRLTFWSLSILLVLNGCGGILVKIAYNNSNWFIKNELDKLFDITWKQDSILNNGLKEFLTYHRQNELPLIYSSMENLKQNASKEKIGYEEISQTTNDLAIMRKRFFDAFFNEDFTAFISTLETDQVDYFSKELSRFTEPHTDKNGKTFWERSDRENQERSLGRRKKNMITWFGEVTPQQEKMLADFPLFDREYYESFYVERKRWKRLIIDQLQRQTRKQAEAKETVALIKSLLRDPQEHVSSPYNTLFDRRMNLIYRFMIDLHATLTPQQKKFFTKQVEYYQEVVTDLMNRI